MSALQTSYFAEFIITAIAIILAIYNHIKKLPGYIQVPIILPWLFIKGAFALGLLLGILQPSHEVTYILLIAGPASVAVLLAVRIWKPELTSRRN